MVARGGVVTAFEFPPERMVVARGEDKGGEDVEVEAKGATRAPGGIVARGDGVVFGRGEVWRGDDDCHEFGVGVAVETAAVLR